MSRIALPPRGVRQVIREAASTAALTLAGAAVLGLAALPARVIAQEPLRLTLQDAIARAQSDGLGARAARAGRDASRQRDRAFGAGLLPQLALTGTAPGYNRSIVSFPDTSGRTIFRPQEQNLSLGSLQLTQRLPYLGGDLTIRSDLQFLDVAGDRGYQTWQSTPLSIRLQQPIFRPNTLRWDIAAQELTAEIAERSYGEAMEDVAIQAANAFFDYYTARLGLLNAETNAAVNDTLYTLNNGRFEVGRIGENDLLQSELALLRAQVAVDGARLEHDRALAALRLALNLPIGAPLDIVVPTEIPEVVADTAIAVAQALRNRASAVDLQLQDTQARRRVAEARLGSGPGASFNATIGFNKTAGIFDSVYRDLRDVQTVSLGLSLPLVNWGGRSANLQAARLDQQRTQRTSQQSREQIRQEAHFAALQLAQTRRSLAIAAKADTVGAKRFEVAKARYVIGRIGVDNLYQAQTEKDGALNGYLQALRAYWVAYYRLRRVTMYDFVTGQAIR
jgi:outer membrane protein